MAHHALEDDAPIQPHVVYTLDAVQSKRVLIRRALRVVLHALVRRPRLGTAAASMRALSTCSTSEIWCDSRCSSQLANVALSWASWVVLVSARATAVAALDALVG